jgi:hypothetical protein
MKTDELIQQLAGNAQPVKRLKPLGQRFVMWLVISWVYIGIIMYFFGIRDDAGSMLRNPMFFTQATLLLVLGVTAGYAAFQISVPDGTLSLPLVGLVIGSAMVSMVLLSYEACTTSGCAAGHGLECSLHIAMLGIIPAMALFLMLKRSAPSRRLWAGALMGLAMIGLSAAALQFACGNSDPLHLLVWHWLPGLLFVSVGVGMASRLLRW